MVGSPFGDDGFLNLEITIAMPHGMPSSQVVSAIFKNRHRQSLEVMPPGNPTWRQLEQYFEPFVDKIRSTRQEIEGQYGIRLPPRCLVLNIRRGVDARGPIVAAIDEKRIRLYRRA